MMLTGEGVSDREDGVLDAAYTLDDRAVLTTDEKYAKARKRSRGRHPLYRVGGRVKWHATLVRTRGVPKR
jgi:hypothetical protein